MPNNEEVQFATWKKHRNRVSSELAEALRLLEPEDLEALLERLRPITNPAHKRLTMYANAQNAAWMLMHLAFSPERFITVLTSNEGEEMRTKTLAPKAYCGECGKSCTIINIDVGIGPYEYWGFQGTDVKIVPASDCCEAQCFSDPEMGHAIKVLPED